MHIYLLLVVPHRISELVAIFGDKVDIALVLDGRGSPLQRWPWQRHGDSCPHSPPWHPLSIELLVSRSFLPSTRVQPGRIESVSSHFRSATAGTLAVISLLDDE
jgi:hypothetical protein